jgi:hypothetical protein
MGVLTLTVKEGEQTPQERVAGRLDLPGTAGPFGCPTQITPPLQVFGQRDSGFSGAAPVILSFLVNPALQTRGTGDEKPGQKRTFVEGEGVFPAILLKSLPELRHIAVEKAIADTDLVLAAADEHTLPKSPPESVKHLVQGMSGTGFRSFGPKHGEDCVPAAETP